MATFLILVAIAGKVITGWTVFGKVKLNRLAIGIGMIPRGVPLDMRDNILYHAMSSDTGGK